MTKAKRIQPCLAKCESYSIFGIAEGRNEYEWGGHPARAKMKRARCPFHGKMPVPRQDARSTARCPFHKTIKIIPLLSNAQKKGTLKGTVKPELDLTF
ncbi:MAG: hypothetical protein F6J94_27400 [Moorea sp. SIO1F2]|uniref:hypothetical protein n=1 Tax=unclassified Moorena TaxID=2683338 RepID=UPI0013B91801|nr:MULTISPECIES: hypothetical protein [unclassified Moorena]NEN98784.1 hypothetical protein [Moorena sp. SIO3I7]NEO20246.1 hypothetical protein [Moorena sp. SIO4A5]NEP22695.1 hypothetical protein [Moorena sp. SIO3I6]NEQ56338.1 hypothetical protein [Moorena sp. SIO4A1]NET85491.1 hypothetical protein [Moorena sp. SIO1F2]